MARRHEVFVTDEQWEKIKPLLPKRRKSAKGGRPPAEDRACLEGILWVLRSGARWRDLPERYPSPSTCWRRLVEWEGEDVLVRIWHASSTRSTSKACSIGTKCSSMPASRRLKKGRPSRKNQAGKGYKVDGGGRWSRSSTCMPDRKCFAC